MCTDHITKIFHFRSNPLVYTHRHTTHSTLKLVSNSQPPLATPNPTNSISITQTPEGSSFTAGKGFAVYNYWAFRLHCQRGELSLLAVFVLRNSTAVKLRSQVSQTAQCLTYPILNYFVVRIYLFTRDSSVNTVTRQQAGRLGLDSRWRQAGCGAHPVSYPMGTGAFSLGPKRQQREVNHSPTSIAKVKNE
jgi:hypothetical protein